MSTTPDWTGQTAAVIASGPSLTPEDVQACRGLRVIVTNTSFRLCPWADVLFAYDRGWWRQYAAEVDATFAGLRYCKHAGGYGCTSLVGVDWAGQLGNSGAAALGLAVHFGAARVILLGVDCSTEDGLHWHGAHEGLRNCMSVAQWPKHFAAARGLADRRGVSVINCSRETALEVFPRVPLALALEGAYA